MATLLSSATLPIADASVLTESISLVVLPAPTTQTGTGRLIHPTFGTYDYTRGPDQWTNMRGAAVIPPIWSSTKTLLGAANTLFAGDIRDVICEEAWVQPTACEVEHLDALLAMWANPPDPTVAYVQWYPNYTTELGFNVIMLDLTLGGKDITITSQVHNGWVRGPLRLRMRIISQIEP